MDILKSSIYELNKKNKANGLDLLATINDKAISVCVFDPQYRGILDKLNYGNEGSREKSRIGLTQMSEETIVKFLMEIDRVLKETGHVFLWIDKFHLNEGDVKRWIAGTNLEIVDSITWDKEKFGMGYRSRSTSEFIVILQKRPKRAKGVWADHSIPDVWREKTDTKNHPHTKPLELQKRLICATTREGDYVLDPAAGSYSVLEACKLTNRNFLGCDIRFGEEK